MSKTIYEAIQPPFADDLITDQAYRICYTVRQGNRRKLIAYFRGFVSWRRFPLSLCWQLQNGTDFELFNEQLVSVERVIDVG